MLEIRVSIVNNKNQYRDKNLKMEETNEQIKIKEARYLIIIPLIITFVCAWLDIWTNYSMGEYSKEAVKTTVQAIVSLEEGQDSLSKQIVTIDILDGQKWVASVTSIIRCCMGYLFPSLLSIVTAMIWQQVSLKDKPYGVGKGKVGATVIVTVFYSTIFITCLIKYNIFSAIVLCVFTLIYIIWFWIYGLDEHIKSKSKNKMTQDELIEYYLNSNKFKRE